MPVQYPIRAAARAAGLTPDTLRAWERRYGAVTPARTDRGRLYEEADVRRLRLLRQAVESGRAIGLVASLSDAELEDLVRRAETSNPALSPSTDRGTTPSVLQSLVEAVQAYDAARTSDELGRIALLLGPAALVREVVLPLMRLAGDNWARGVFQIAHEHVLSVCVRNLLGGLLRLERAGRPSGRLLLTTPSGELHEFGILAAALLAVAHGFDAAYLGPNLPVGEILSAARRRAPQAVVLGLMTTNATPAVRDDLGRLAAGLPPATELWVGGSGAAEALASVGRNGVLALDDFEAFERHLDRLAAARTRESRR